MLELRNLRHSFGKTTVLHGVSLKIAQGAFFSLLGPSGCGKTTLLRLIAGFESIQDGEIHLNGERIDHLPSYKRPFNMVFQKYALFPHMSVFENIAFGLKMKKTPQPELETRVAEAMELVRMKDFARRSVTTLSGGQCQRVALARALVNRPKILLLDEPLSALDLKLRGQMQVELMELHKKTGTTFIFVTHDQEEAMTMSSEIAVLNQGLIEQVGTPREIYDDPKTLFAAQFIGASNTIPLAKNDSEDTVLVRPEDLHLELPHSSTSKNASSTDGTSSLIARIEEILFKGPFTEIVVRDEKSGTILRAIESAQMNNKPHFRAGDAVRVFWKSSDELRVKG